MSMGGGQSLNIGLTNLDTFDWIPGLDARCQNGSGLRNRHGRIERIGTILRVRDRHAEHDQGRH